MVYYPVSFEVICCYFNVLYKTDWFGSNRIQISTYFLFFKTFCYMALCISDVYMTFKFSTVMDEFRTLIFKYVLFCLLVDHLIFDLFCIQ